MRQIIFNEFQRAAGSVCRHFGVDEVQMLHSNKNYCVDARAVLVSVLTDKGLSESELVELTGLTQQCINRLKNSIRFREKGWTFRESLRSIRHELNEQEELKC